MTLAVLDATYVHSQAEDAEAKRLALINPAPLSDDLADTESALFQQPETDELGNVRCVECVVSADRERRVGECQVCRVHYFSSQGTTSWEVSGV